MNDKSMQHQWSTSFYENAFTPVPPNGRKSTQNVLIVTMGYVVALSCFVIGTKVGHALPFWQAIWACIIGNLILMAIGIGMGIMGMESGWSTAFLARRLFGKQASLLVSVLIMLLCIYWVGMNGDSFARMIVTAFPRWPVPVAVTAVTLVALWGVTAAYGWRGLAMTSWVLTPLAMMLAITNVALIDTNINFIDALQRFVPTGSLTPTMAIAAVTGNYIFGCIISPDLCRFAKSKTAVAQVILPSYTIGFILPNICGVLVAQLGDSADFGVSVARLGFAVPFLVSGAMSLWTTENYNIYCGSLAAQNLFLGTSVEGNLSHRVAAWILAGLSAAFAALKALDYLIPIITVLASLVPPVAGMMFAEYFVLGGRKKHEFTCQSRWIWVTAWALGGAVGIWSYYENFLISPANALVVAGVVYTLLRLATGKRPEQPQR